MLLSLYRYISVTVSSVEVSEGKAKELNFTLTPVVSEAAGSSTTVATTSVQSISHPDSSTTSFSGSTQTPVVTSVSPTSHQLANQPQEFRHHNYADMELFLRKYSSEFPSITHLYSIGQSVEKRELYVMVISDNPVTHEHGM